MRYKIIFKASAKKELRKLPKIEYITIKSSIDDLAVNPRPIGVRKMVGGNNQWRLRVGVYRVVYTIIDNQLIIEIIRIAHRKDAYRNWLVCILYPGLRSTPVVSAFSITTGHAWVDESKKSMVFIQALEVPDEVNVKSTISGEEVFEACHL